MSSIPRCSTNNEVRELTWENGQLSLHGLLPDHPPNINCQTKETYGLDNCTLESIVHQATSNFPSSSAKWRDGSGDHMQMMEGSHESMMGVKVKVKEKESINVVCSSSHGLVKKRERGDIQSSSQQCGRSNYNVQQVEESACGSASATFCRDTTMMTWPSLESPRSLKCARTTDHDDSLSLDCSENQDGEGTKGESFRSRRSRAAAIHNQSERRRRDRINEKMKTLQKLVPNASKTDKASMLDEVIEYLKQLQAQVHMMSNARNMPQMAMPMGMQQLQMSLLARMGMGMGMGMGMLDANTLARNVPNSFPPLLHVSAPTPSFVPQPFAMPPMAAPLKPNFDAAPVPNFNDAYNTFVAQQSMNMDFLNKMSALYRQQSSQQPSKKPVSLSLPNDGRGHGQ